MSQNLEPIEEDYEPALTRPADQPEEAETDVLATPIEAFERKAYLLPGQNPKPKT